jgi:2-polyprenyl-6-methoxyphenol hydroxylase-like FAD-dependent oxidoreductase
MWPAVGAGIALHANGVRALRVLGLREAINQAAEALPRWSFCDKRGDLLCETDLSALWQEVGPCLGTERVRLQSALLVDGRLERFRQRFAQFGGPAPEYLAALERDQQLHAEPIEWVELDRWHRGRVVLIGDAAHATPPHMGEGGCMAIEDAVILAEALRTAEGVSCALDLYAARRKARVEWVQQQSLEAAKGWVLPSAVRNEILRKRGDQMLQARYRPLIMPL